MRKRNSPRLAGPLSLIALGLWLALTSVGGVNAQPVNVKIRLTSVAPAKLNMEVGLLVGTRVLSFRNTYASVIGLGERIEAVAAVDGSGQPIPVEKVGPGEFRSSETFIRINYEVNVPEPTRAAQMSHITWLQRNQGLLMLSDLLPHGTGDSSRFASAVISLEVPPDWSVASNTKREGAQFSSNDLETAVFLVGPSVQEKHQQLGSTDFAIVTAGEWPFSNKDALQVAGRIMVEHLRVTRSPLKNPAVLMLVPYPGEAGPENWSAETRGNDVVLVLGRNSNRRRVLARLGIVLSHELFHLWVPNSLGLKGDYDWFFEGFTLYQALRTDLRLGLISFDDYLQTIASVYDAYNSRPGADKLSLVEASERRWTTSSSFVYEKGMLAGFIYDLMLRKVSDCSDSLDGIYADLFSRAERGQGSANETIIKLLSEHGDLKSFARDYIESAGRLSLEEPLSSYGIAVSSETGRTRLVVSGDVNKTERKLLKCIGYKK